VYLRLANKPVAAAAIVFQLECLTALFNDAGKVSQTNTNYERWRYINDTYEQIYGHFDTLARVERYDEDWNKQLRSKKCILVTNSNTHTYTLMSPNCCALSLPVMNDVLLPYLCAVPGAMQRNHRPMVDALQIKNSFSARDFVDVLSSMQLRYQGTPVTPEDRNVAINIINKCPTSDIRDKSLIPVPNILGVLRPVKSLCFNDYPSITDIDVSDVCHSDVLLKAAVGLGMKTIRQEYMRLNSRPLGRRFGQREGLITRLKRILSGYPFDEEVLKEMLQNADDAGATQLHFIIDPRQLPDKKVFCNAWKSLQGPALCVFNNSTFSSQDIEGIQKLGEGSKGDDPTKTGQYGVGFNCVYHITDAPILHTHVEGEEVLCVFDPTCNYVPGAEDSSPGRQMILTSEFKSQFSDVFAGCLDTVYGSSNGSFFRLPLRNVEKSGNKLLSTQSVTVNTIRLLFEKLKELMSELLLFLNSVEEIQLKEVNPYTGECAMTYKVQVQLTEDDRSKRDNFISRVRELAVSLKKGELRLSDIEPIETTYTLTTVDSNNKKNVWLIVQRFGFSSIPTSLEEHTRW
jgi:sacsin